MPPKPKSVVLVAVFLFMATGIALVVGVSLIFPNPVTQWLWKLNEPGERAFRAAGRWAGCPLLLLGVGAFATARALLRGRWWAWWFAVVLFVANGIGDLVSFIV